MYGSRQRTFCYPGSTASEPPGIFWFLISPTGTNWSDREVIDLSLEISMLEVLVLARLGLAS